MEVRSESGMMTVKDGFGIGAPKTPVPQPIPNMRLVYAADGTAVYKPVSAVFASPYQAGGGVFGGAGAVPSGAGSVSGGAGGVFSGTGGGGGVTGAASVGAGIASGGAGSVSVGACGVSGAGGSGAGGVSSVSGAGVGGVSGNAVSVANTGAVPISGDGNSNSPAMASLGLNVSSGEPMKRKRGRPRKYGPDGTISRALVPMSSPGTGASPVSGAFSPTSPTGTGTPFSHARPLTMKKAMGRPPGSGKKQQMAALGLGGIGFTPHVITVLAGEDVSSKIMSFSHHGPRAVCILSANGAISTVTLRQAATSGGTVTYEGRFEILSLSGSYMLSENDGQRSRTGGLSVCLAGPDGRVLGGGVAGILVAASPVQVVVGSFIADGRKESKQAAPSDTAPAPAPGKLPYSGSFIADGRKESKQSAPSDTAPASGKLPYSRMMGAATPPGRGGMSESSDGPGSPLNQSTGASNDSHKQGMPNMQWN